MLAGCGSLYLQTPVHIYTHAKGHLLSYIYCKYSPHNPSMWVTRSLQTSSIVLLGQAARTGVFVVLGRPCVSATRHMAAAAPEDYKPAASGHEKTAKACKQVGEEGKVPIAQVGRGRRIPPLRCSGSLLVATVDWPVWTWAGRESSTTAMPSHCRCWPRSHPPTTNTTANTTLFVHPLPPAVHKLSNARLPPDDGKGHCVPLQLLLLLLATPPPGSPVA